MTTQTATAHVSRTLVDAQHCLQCKRMGDSVWLFVQRDAQFSFTPGNNSFKVDFKGQTVETTCRRGHVNVWTVDLQA